LIRKFTQQFREFWIILPPQTRTAWLWDLATGMLAGLYQGCIWTFVFRIARADLKADAAQIGWIAAAPALGYLFATVWARQMEGRAKMPFVYWTWLVARGMFLLAPLITTSKPFIALVCITPLIFSVSMPAYTAIMKEIYPDAHRGRLMSIVRIGLNTMMFLTALIMGRLLDAGLPWQTSFCLGGLFGAASALTFSRIPVGNQVEETEERTSAGSFFRDTFGILVRNPGYRWFSASVFVSGFGNIISSTLIPIYQVDRFHVTNTQVANLQNMTSVATIIGFFFWGTFLDRKGPLTAVLVALALNLTVPLLYAGAWGMSALYLAAVFTGLAMAGIDLAYLNSTLLFSEPGKAAQYQALHSSFFGVRGSIAPHCAIPLMHAVGPQRAFLIAFCILCAGTLLQMFSMRDYRRQQ
jgi:predicted MFS family arabinose efflux permease